MNFSNVRMEVKFHCKLLKLDLYEKKAYNFWCLALNYVGSVSKYYLEKIVV